MKKNTVTLISIFASVIVIFATFIIRLMSHNQTLIGEYSYSYFTPTTPNLFSTIISSVNLSLSGYWAFPLIGTIILILLAYRLIGINLQETEKRLANLGFFILSPTILYLSNYLSPYLLGLILIFTSLNLIHSKYPLTASIPLIFTLFFDWLTAIATILLVLPYLAYIKKKRIITPLLSYAIAFVIVHILTPRPFFFETFPNNQFTISLLSDFGSIHGFGIFTILLAVIGFALSWKYKSTLTPTYVSIILLILLTTYNPHALIFLSPLLAGFAAWAFICFWQRKWSLPLIRFLTIATIIYGVIFSSVAFVDRVAASPPTTEVFESMQEIKDTTTPTEVILSHPEKGFWIEYGAKRTPFITYGDKKYDLKWEQTQKIFASRDLTEVTTFLEENNISMIWIDKKMKTGQVWDENAEGLLFLLRNERFKRVYFRNKVEVWRFN
jgi:hypothetical protein